jgi:hypothetical protein
MSSTKRNSASRLKSDAYQTPLWCTRLLLEVLHLPGGRWLDPGAGEGAIIRAVQSEREDVAWTALDIRDCVLELGDMGEIEEVTVADFHTWQPEKRFDVAITNPPYSRAMSFIENSFIHAEHVVMLLRLNFLSSAARAPFMRRYVPDVYVLPNRPSFTGGGTDSIDYAWFHWGAHREDRDTGSLQVLRPLSKKERVKMCS